MPLGDVAANLRAAKELVFLPPLKNAKDFHIGGRTKHLPGKKKSSALSLTGFGEAWLKGAICNIISLLDVAVFRTSLTASAAATLTQSQTEQNHQCFVSSQKFSRLTCSSGFFFFCKLHSLVPFYHFPLLAAAVSIQWHLFNADKCLHGVQEEEEQEGRVMGSGGREEEEIRMD